MRNIFYVFGSITCVLVTVTLGLYWLLVIAFYSWPTFRHEYLRILGSQSDNTTAIYSPTTRSPRVVATTTKPDQISIEDLTQLSAGGTSLGLVYTTKESDVEPQYGGFYMDRSAIVDQRESSRECKKLDEDDAPGPDACRIYPSFFGYQQNDDSPYTRTSRYPRNAVEIDASGKEHVLFPNPVRISHIEILWGRSADYAVFAYVDEDTDKDGKLTRHDTRRLAVLNLKTLAFATLGLPGSFLDMESIIGRNDTFKILVGDDLDKNGGFDPIVEPIHAVSVNFATGEVKPAISDAAMAALQKQFDDAAARPAAP